MSATEREAYPATVHVECPYSGYRRARVGRPVYFDPELDAYVVWSHQDVQFVLANSELFPIWHDPSDERKSSQALTYEGVPHLGHTDEPQHAPMRRLMSRPLSPGRLRRAAPWMTAIADALIDQFIDRGSAEFVAEFAYPMPARVICGLLGLDTEGERFDFVKRWSTVFIKPSEAADADNRAMHAYIREAVLDRHSTPRDDALSELIALQVDRDGELDLRQMVIIGTELVIGGVLTTGQVIAHTMWFLLSNPEQAQRVRDDQRLIPSMFEEALRLELPIQWRDRTAGEPVELGGVAIPRGARIWLVLGSASRDEQCFADPDRFVVDRPPQELKRHLGFGLGSHFCLGAPLARLEGRISYERLFARLGAIRLAPDAEVQHLETELQLFRGLRELPITFERL